MDRLCYYLLTIFLIVSIPSLANSRIGETIQQCTERYGQIIEKTNEGLNVFSKSNYYIAVQFHNGIADTIAYVKQKKPGELFRPDLSDTEINELLKKNSDKPWETLSVVSLDDYWRTTDGKVIAFYNKGKSRLVILTKDAQERAKLEKTLRETKELEDF